MRREELYLSDIVETADTIARYLGGVNQDAFLKDEVKRDAVLYKLIIIGEAAARVSKALRKRHPQVQWDDVITFRNRAVHIYFGVKWEFVWAAATQDAPKLRGLSADILAKEFPDRLPFAEGQSR